MPPVVLILLLWFVALSAADLRSCRLPNRLVLPGVLGALAGVVTAPEAAAGLLVAGGVYLVAYRVGGCGGGDVKLAVVLGALAGSAGAAALLVISAQVLTLVQATLGRRGADNTRARPHGPALCGAAALCCGIW